MESEVGWKLSEMPSLSDCDQWHKIQVEASHGCLLQGLIPWPTLLYLCSSDLGDGMDAPSITSQFM